jgi:hypothetical protein
VKGHSKDSEITLPSIFIFSKSAKMKNRNINFSSLASGQKMEGFLGEEIFCPRAKAKPRRPARLSAEPSRKIFFSF